MGLIILKMEKFAKVADNTHDECLVVFGKDQLLRVRGTLDEVSQRYLKAQPTLQGE